MSRLVHEAEADVPVELTRRGRPVAVVISIEKYQRLASRPRRPLWETINEFRDTHDMTSEDLSAAFDDARSSSVSGACPSPSAGQLFKTTWTGLRRLN
ncbi:MAG: type II toxin-antitoxin system prevent-host-death family antitoxin [Oligoflexia bacterium]|nr:type II toxin-antitoxin system prevent-host-death family antitoxin [Oligoflexia bacterium]